MGGGLVLFGIGGDDRAAAWSTRSPAAQQRRRTPAEALREARSSARRQGARTRGRGRLGGSSPARASSSPARATTTTTTRHLHGRGQGRARSRPRRHGSSYLALDPQTSRTTRVARLMVQAYVSLGELDKADDAPRRSWPRPRDAAGAYAQLAVLAYQAGQTRKGDLAAEKALELTRQGPARSRSRRELDQAKPAADQAAQQRRSVAERPRRTHRRGRYHVRPPRPCSSTGRAADS